MKTNMKVAEVLFVLFRLSSRNEINELLRTQLKLPCFKLKDFERTNELKSKQI